MEEITKMHTETLKTGDAINAVGGESQVSALTVDQE
jgi:hypothetical protein